MAYDKIYTIRARLYDRICYILDPAKTTAESKPPAKPEA